MKEIIVNHITTSTIQSDNSQITVNTNNGTIIQSIGNTVARISGIFAGDDKPRVDIHTIRGTFNNPKSLQSGDYGMNLSFTTYFNQNNHDMGKSLVSLVPQIEINADINHPAPASNLNLLVNAGDGSGEYANDYRVWKFSSDGSLRSKIFQCAEQDTASINNIKPKNGMIVYNNDTNKFQGYSNGTWVDLH